MFVWEAQTASSFEAWASVWRALLSAGYGYSRVFLNVHDCGQPVSRNREFAVCIHEDISAGRLGALQADVRELVNSQRRGAAQPDMQQSCIIDPSVLEQCGLVGAILDAFVLSEAASTVVELVGTMANCCDVVDAHPPRKLNASTAAQPPCITVSTCWLRLCWVKQRRYLYPQELMLMLGFPMAIVIRESQCVVKGGLVALEELSRRVAGCTAPIVASILRAAVLMHVTVALPPRMLLLDERVCNVRECQNEFME